MPPIMPPSNPTSPDGPMSSEQETGYPLVSVIIPVYNRDDYIEEALDSVLAEDYPNLELVVIDDGSSDNTASVIQAWAKRNAHRIPMDFYSRENRGFMPTLNELIERSHGQYIVFFGSDDCLRNNGIRQRYDYLQAHPDKRMVVGDCHLIDSQGQVIHPSAYVAIGKADKQLMGTDEGLIQYTLLNGYYPGATLMADKRIYQEMGLYDLRYSAEDWPFYSRVVARRRLGFLNSVVSAYRIHDNNMCFSRTQLKIAKQQLHQMVTQLWGEYQGKHRLWLAQRVVYQLAYIPYLSLKFDLIDAANGNNKLAAGVLNTVLWLKSAVMAPLKQALARS